MPLAVRQWDLHVHWSEKLVNWGEWVGVIREKSQFCGLIYDAQQKILLWKVMPISIACDFILLNDASKEGPDRAIGAIGTTQAPHL